MIVTRLVPIFAALLIGEGVLANGAVAAPAHRPAQASIKAVTLTSGDVTGIYGKGFKTFINGVISNKDLASAEKTAGSTSSPSVASTGRVTGYETVWFRGNKTASLSLSNAVSQYRNSGYPHAAFSAMARQGGTHKKGYTSHLSPFSGVGDEARLYTSSSHGATSLGIIFRRGRYFAQVTVGTQHGTVGRSSVAKLAAIEDQRIQAHG